MKEPTRKERKLLDGLLDTLLDGLVETSKQPTSIEELSPELMEIEKNKGG
jgi:hypothetical protein